jgi:hypothetical protein
MKHKRILVHPQTKATLLINVRIRSRSYSPRMITGKD